jgi:type IV pilus assembly protein PilN
MRLSINLATRPYVELGPIFRNLRIAMGVLAVAALGLGIWLHILSAKAREQQKALDAIHAQTTKLRAERAGNEARMRLPQNATELQRSQFLNALFARKSFSWTAVLMDLEEVLPAGVQVSSIEPQIVANGDVNIRLRVAGDRDRAVELVRNLEKSKRFVAPRLLGESAQQQKENNRPGFGGPPVLPNGVEFEILSGYNPLQARVSEAKKAKNAVQAEVRP